MNYFYKGLLTVTFIASAAVSSYAAEGEGVLFNINNASLVTVTVGGKEITVTDGEQLIPIDYRQEVVVTANDDAMLTAITFYTDYAGYERNDGFVTSFKRTFDQLTPVYDATNTSGNRNYLNVTAKTLEEALPLTATINVDNAANLAPVEVTYAINEYQSHAALTPAQTMVDGANTVRFTDQLESYGDFYKAQVKLETLNGQPLYKVLVNNVAATPNDDGVSYTVKLADGDVIDVTTTIPDESANVSFTLLNDGEEAVESVNVNDNAVENWAEGLDVKLGDKVTVKFNTDDYKINQALWNDTEGSTWELTGFVMGNTVITIDAKKYAIYNVTVNVNNAAAVKMQDARYTVIALEDGANTIQVNEHANYVRIQPSSDEYLINSVKINDQPVEPMDGSFSFNIVEDCTIDIDAAAKVYDQNFVLYWHTDHFGDNVSFFNSNYKYFMPEGSSDPVEGYNFYKATKQEIDATPIYLNIYDYSYYSGDYYLYVNGELTQGTGYTVRYTFSEDSPLANGTVIKFYTEQPTACAVTFDVEEDVQFTATHDYVAEFTPESTFSCFPGTVIQLESANELIVKVNDVVIEKESASEGDENSEVATLAAATNVYSFTVNGDDNVSIEAVIPVLVNNINAENGETVIYNLQGVRVNSNNLPAGVYIMNGKKVMVK